jgi:transposase
MSESHPGTDRAGRRRKRFLTPAQTDEIWVGLLRGQDHDPCRSRRARRGPLHDPQATHGRPPRRLDALAKSKPGVRVDGPDPELTAAKVEICRLSEAGKEMGVRLMLIEGKGHWDPAAGSLAGSIRPSRPACPT